MDFRILVALSLAVFLVLPIAQATSACPANQAHIGPYNKLEVLPKGYKLVGQQFTVKVTRVESQVETPLAGRTVTIYLMNGTRTTRLASGNTNSKGEYYYTPTQVGKYKVESSGRAPTFDVWRQLSASELGAVCGNGICELDKGETKDNCPVDCTTCGDSVCEGLEDKDNCPQDCIICGDGDCDEPEYWPGGCSCPEDCIKCGDGICDLAHNETSTTCPKDCKYDGTNDDKKASGDFISAYWWAILIAVVVIVVIVLKKYRPEIFERKKSEKPVGHKREHRHSYSSGTKESKKSVEEDEDINGIIVELMDSGISEKHMREKLKEFGLGEEEAEKLIEKAKK